MTKSLLALSVLAACGNAADGGGTLPDAGGDPVPAMITVSGQVAQAVYADDVSPLPGIPVRAFDRDDELTPIAEATADDLGNFTLSIPTNGEPFDGYLLAHDEFTQQQVDTYFYLSAPLSADSAGLLVPLLSPYLMGLLVNECNPDQAAGKGVIVAVATDSARKPVEGVTFTSAPAANRYCYNDGVWSPAPLQLRTIADGIGYMFNVVGPVTVTANKTGADFKPRLVTARPDVVTMVLIAP
ncbi:MAG: hypothetical protein HOV81_45320 [Kofleriaceae bacterium]|nr:hypothetical protein [Kofleriaceae bacterium]